MQPSKSNAGDALIGAGGTCMYWWVAGIAVALQLAALHLQRRWVDFDKAAMGVQSLATAAALLFAGTGSSTSARGSRRRTPDWRWSG